MGLIEQIYASAANAGLLEDCLWQPASGSEPQSAKVGFAAPDDNVLDGLALNTDYQMTYPASVLVGLAVRDVVQVNGAHYQVREVRAVGDGSEMRTKLARL
jgi:hypothetical protein